MRRKERTDSIKLSPDLHIYAMSHVPPLHHHTTTHRDAHAHTCVCVYVVFNVVRKAYQKVFMHFVKSLLLY